MNKIIEAGQVLQNRNGFDYRIISVNADSAVVQRLKDAWTHTVSGIQVCEDGRIQWAASGSDGHFAKAEEKKDWLLSIGAILAGKILKQAPEVCRGAATGNPIYFVGGNGVPTDVPDEVDQYKRLVENVQVAGVYAIASNQYVDAFLLVDERDAENYKLPSIDGLSKFVKTVGQYHTVKAWVHRGCDSHGYMTTVTVKETPAGGMALADVGAPFPELAYYDEEEHKFFQERSDNSDIAEMGLGEDVLVDYEVIFDVGEERYYFYTQALNGHEALGMFFEMHPHITFNDVLDVIQC